jgi:hypothetical protein
LVPQNRASLFGQSKLKRSPIKEKLEGGKKKSRNTLIASKTTQEELNQDKKRAGKLKVSIDLTSQSKSSMRLIQTKVQGRNQALI